MSGQASGGSGEQAAGDSDAAEPEPPIPLGPLMASFPVPYDSGPRRVYQPSSPSTCRTWGEPPPNTSFAAALYWYQ